MTDTAALIETLAALIVQNYVFPARAAEADRVLRENALAGAYDGDGGEAFCARVNVDLFATCADKHLRLIWHATPLDPTSDEDEESVVTELREMFRLEGQGVRRVERLSGNVGLIALTIIPPADLGGAIAGAAMALVAETEALIFDLRQARGGAPDGVALWCSFLFPDGETHLTDVVHGTGGPTRQFWTAAYVPGPRYLDRPVFALISGETFSGGEAMAYDLQAHGRATLVGETTRGGAHLVEPRQLTPHIELRLPVARPLSPVTGANWEAVGVQPDLPVPADEALETAHRTALNPPEHVAAMRRSVS